MCVKYHALAALMSYPSFFPFFFNFTRYGVIHGAASVELQPLDRDVDEEEEDMTLFDMKDAKRPLK